jgi:hypothetical protein
VSGGIFADQHHYNIVTVSLNCHLRGSPRLQNKTIEQPLENHNFMMVRGKTESTQSCIVRSERDAKLTPLGENANPKGRVRKLDRVTTSTTLDCRPKNPSRIVSVWDWDANGAPSGEKITHRLSLRGAKKGPDLS